MEMNLPPFMFLAYTDHRRQLIRYMKARRESFGMTKLDMAHNLGITRVTLDRLESASDLKSNYKPGIELIVNYLAHLGQAAVLMLPDSTSMKQNYPWLIKNQYIDETLDRDFKERLLLEKIIAEKK